MRTPPLGITEGRPPRRNTGGRGHPSRAGAGHTPWPAVNVALVEWLMLPDAPDPAAVLADLLRRPPWHQDALCRGVGVEQFFIERGSQYGASRALCARCPVSEECLEVAMGDALLDGLWSNTTPRQRRAMRRARVA